MYGEVESRIRRDIERHGTICFGLIDPENNPPEIASGLAAKIEEYGVRGILVGGSTAADQFEIDKVVRAIKSRVEIPVILFPGNASGVVPSADAVLFISLLNSEDPYFITGAQALGSLLVNKYGIEAIPVGYLVVGEGGAIGFVGKVRPIPLYKPELAVMYSLAAWYMGMRFVYLEAGSGVASHVPPEFVRKVRASYKGVLMVGGGIRDGATAKELAKAGADILVVGTLIEKDVEKVREVVEEAMG